MSGNGTPLMVGRGYEGIFLIRLWMEFSRKQCGMFPALMGSYVASYDYTFPRSLRGKKRKTRWMRNICASIQSSYDFPRTPGSRELLEAEWTSNHRNTEIRWVHIKKYKRVNGSLYFCKNILKTHWTKARFSFLS